MSEFNTPDNASGSNAHRARELTAELRRLQESVESLDATLIQENVQKVRELLVLLLFVQDLHR